MPRVIDEMPTLAEVENASAYDIVRWHLFLRPTMSNDELVIVKAITQKYDSMSASTRETFAARARREMT